MKKGIFIRIPSIMKEAIRKIAREDGEKMNTVIRWAIKEFLEKRK